MTLRTNRTFPLWLGGMICGVGLPLAHGVAPWAISLLTTRYGWVEGHPGPWNWIGLILVVAGFAGVAWALVPHFKEAPRGWEFEQTPKYLLTRGPYRFTRNPIYIAYAPLWLGWVIFYGSVAIVGFLVLMAPVGWVVVRRE